MNEIHRLLDRHIAVLTELGSTVATHLTNPPTTSYIRSIFHARGLHDRSEVVDFFTWTTPAREQLWLFNEASFLIPVEYAIEILETNDKYQPASDPMTFPGPSYLLPITYMQGTDYVAVDTRPDPLGGSVWYCSLGNSLIYELFDSIQTTIRVATYCLTAGLWTVERDGQYSIVVPRGPDDHEPPTDTSGHLRL